MTWSFPIGTVAGTTIRIHLTFLLLLLWIGGSALRAGRRARGHASVVLVCLLFLCVLLHEFGHAFAARRYGVQHAGHHPAADRRRGRLERIPEKPVAGTGGGAGRPAR